MTRLHMAGLLHEVTPTNYVRVREAFPVHMHILS